MLDPHRADPSLLHLVDRVAGEIMAKSTLLVPAEVMLVGARCRDILQSALGHEFALRVTSDIDLGLAVANWAAYDELVTRFPSAGKTGIRFRIAETTADLMPFGPVENPPGTVTPATRREPINVWGFAEVYAAAHPLELPTVGSIRIPGAAGYAALKVAAWLDRSDYGEYKDAVDIATVIYWYTKSAAVEIFVYETERGQALLIEEDLDDAAAAARVLGEDISGIVGPERLSEIARRWPGSARDLLVHHMTVTNAPDWPASPNRRHTLLRALERGLGLG
ncbi:hypothetical protein AB0J83_11560 [Actinoplanes sp. NPDC049596]|uniref:hypothetical protein n=1 Tax=unclassified Actinoplanes TaxID=2626549 RepID=UPI00344AC13F